VLQIFLEEKLSPDSSNPFLNY